MQKRLRTVFKGAAAAGGIGTVYYLLCRFTSFSIPCVFRTLFHVYCPGCGVTRMMMHIVQLDFSAAAANNLFLFISLPFLAVFFGIMLVQYIRTGKAGTAPWQKVCLYCYAALLVLYGILRNIPACAVLAPH